MSKIALITGGSRGIGLGIAIELAKAGFDLAINGMRDEIQVQPVLEELRNFGVQVAYFKRDVSRKDDRQQMVEAILSRFGKINILVNNAGIAPPERKMPMATRQSYPY